MELTWALSGTLFTFFVFHPVFNHRGGGRGGVLEEKTSIVAAEAGNTLRS